MKTKITVTYTIDDEGSVERRHCLRELIKGHPKRWNLLTGNNGYNMFLAENLNELTDEEDLSWKIESTITAEDL